MKVEDLPSVAPALPWTKTPCIRSTPLSKIAGCNIWLKLENLQPSGSFKSRGVGNMMHRAAISRARDPSLPSPHYFCSSGGNAGLACASAAQALGRPATIVVPETTSTMMIAKLRALDATVIQTGRSWSEADQHLRMSLLAREPHAGVYVPPFDHEDIWDGVAGMVDEVIDEFRSRRAADQGGKVDVHAFVCSVGGGGLLNGIVQGIERRPEAWQRPPPVVLAVETEGADSLNASVRAGKLVTLPAIVSIATSLGAVTVCKRTWEYASRGLPAGLGEANDVVEPMVVVDGRGGRGGNGSHAAVNGNGNPHDMATKLATTTMNGDDKPVVRASVVSVTVTDAATVNAMCRFTDDVRMLVEPACAASLAVVYGDQLREQLRRPGEDDDEWREKNVVIVVCGGSAVSLALLEEYKKKFGIE